MANANRLVGIFINPEQAKVLADEINSGTADKPQIAALTPLAGGADLAATVAKVNAIIAALKA